MWTMVVETPYYRLLKSGAKTVELRLYHEKRQQMKVGDEILFSDKSHPTECFTAVILALHRAKNFLNLCDVITPQQAGFSSKEELLAVMGKFYSPQMQQKFGVTGIEIKKK